MEECENSLLEANSLVKQTLILQLFKQRRLSDVHIKLGGMQSFVEAEGSV